MEKSAKKYWGVVTRNKQGRQITYEGSFKQCWDWLSSNFGHFTLEQVTIQMGMKIERIG